MKKKYYFTIPEKFSMDSLVEDTLNGYEEIDKSIRERTLNVYAYDCFDYSGDGNYFATPDCMVGENT
jgi:hypothetical protein